MYRSARDYYRYSEMVAEAPEFVQISARVSTARKPHRCNACEDPILAGEKYRREVFTEDGEFTIYKQHQRLCGMELRMAQQEAEWAEAQAAEEADYDEDEIPF